MGDGRGGDANRIGRSGSLELVSFSVRMLSCFEEIGYGLWEGRRRGAEGVGDGLYQVHFFETVCSFTTLPMRVGIDAA